MGFWVLNNFHPKLTNKRHVRFTSFQKPRLQLTRSHLHRIKEDVRESKHSPSSQWLQLKNRGEYDTIAPLRIMACQHKQPWFVQKAVETFVTMVSQSNQPCFVQKAVETLVVVSVGMTLINLLCLTHNKK